MLVSIAHPKINYFFLIQTILREKKGFLNVEWHTAYAKHHSAPFFEKFFVPRGLSSFFAALEALRPLRTFGPLCPGKAAGTVSRSTRLSSRRLPLFYSLDLRLSRERGRASARQIKLLSIFSLEYIFIIFFISYVVVSRLLDVCWMSVGCLLNVCCSECWTDAPAYC